MDIQNKNNKFINYLLLLFSLIMLVFFAKGEYTLLQEKLDTKESFISENITLSKKLGDLNSLKNDIDTYNKSYSGTLIERNLILSKLTGSGSNSTGKLNNIRYDRISNIKKFLTPVTEDAIIREIYGYFSDKKSIINSLTLSAPKDNEFGFKESSLNISLYVSDEKELFDIINFLSDNYPKENAIKIKKGSNYKMFFNTLSYPIDKPDQGFAVSFPLRIFYK